MTIIMGNLFMALAEATRVPDPDGPTIHDPASFLPYRDADGRLCEAFAWDRGAVRGDDWVARYYDGAGNPVRPGEVLNPEYTRRIREVTTPGRTDRGFYEPDEVAYEWSVTRLVPGSGGRTQELGRGWTADPGQAVRRCLAVAVPPPPSPPPPTGLTLAEAILAGADRLAVARRGGVD